MQKKDNGEMSYSPTDLTRYFESRFASWMDRYEKLFGNNGPLGKINKNPPDAMLELLKQKGMEHEASVIKSHSQGSFMEIEGENQREKRDKTINAMKKGIDVIYQAALGSEIFFGYADILQKKEGKSGFGNHYYVPYDIKLASIPRPTAVLQLLAYCDLLEKLQNRLPDEIGIITKDGSLHTYLVASLFHYYFFFKKDFLEFHKLFSPEIQPLPEKIKEHRNWSIYAKKVLHERDDVALTAKIRTGQIEILKKKGLETLTQLAQYKGKKIKGIPDNILETLIKQAQLQIASKGKRPPCYEVLDHLGRMGLAMMPDSTENDLFFDMEGYPIIGKNGLEYLYGFADGKRNYRTIWAYYPQDESKAFKGFMEFVYKRWAKNREMKIYHYGHYEPSTLKRLMGQYGLCEEMVDDLLRAEVFVDLYQVLKQALVVGTYNYGLKSIESLYYPERKTEVSSGSESAVEFSQWLSVGGDPTKSSFLKRIEDYNKDDCLSTLDLEKFLRKIKDDKGIKYVPFTLDDGPKKEKDPNSLKAICSKQANLMLESLNPEQRRVPFKDADISSYVCEQLAHCLDFVSREEKPDWWEYFSKQDLSYEDLYEDPDTLVDVCITSSSGQEIKGVFDVEQDSKFHKESKVRIMENQAAYENLIVKNIDYTRGEITLSVKKCKTIPGKKFTLVPGKVFFNKGMVLKSLLLHAQSYNKKSRYFGLKKCVYDMLTKSPPDINGRRPGEPLIKGNDIISELTNLTLNMNETTLCVQGPPGSGKTYIASRVINDLIKQGKRVAISSNSHKAMNYLAGKVSELNRNCSIVKLSSGTKFKEDREQFEGGHIEVKPTSSKQFDLGCYDLIVGTVYYLSKLKDEVDYLFIDEATQVALPNLLAMASCTNNIVLFGDQMQLEQPIKGSHPGESGTSALIYLTNGLQTVAPDFGVFLDKTYRMHPTICSFISNQFYEERLHSISDTSKQKILWNNYKQSGLLFMPIEHTGNTHASEEEAECIIGLWNKALKSEWIDRQGNQRRITPDDVLIVAPYNHQVAILKDKLPEASIGTVDLFQGQEAAMVIVSMCSSSLEDAPRGAGFLLNANRVNVAISRAKALSIVIGSPELAKGQSSSIESMKLISTYCHLVMNYKASS